MKVAILVDGGYYRKKAYATFGDKSPNERADELYSYCLRHLSWKKQDGTQPNELYRLFYYDSPPSEKKVFHPILGKTIDLKKSDLYMWTIDFFKNLSEKRKVALRLGTLSDNELYYNLKNEVTKKLVKGEKEISSLLQDDFYLNMIQKGVDMKIGLDIASLSYKKQVDQIVLIAGDSDFVPAAKLARREGIDFILDPLGSTIKPDLSLHIDGLRTCDKKYTEKTLQKNKPTPGAKDSQS